MLNLTSVGVKWFVVSYFVVVVISGVFWLFAFVGRRDREKRSPYECGFDPKGSARAPFSLRFFLLAIVFIIFDVEVVVLVPYIFFGGVSVWSFMGAIIFLFVLFVGLLHEWREGSLEWQT